MLKKLKRSILATNIILTAAVLVGTFSVFFLSNFCSAYREQRINLRALPELYHSGSCIPVSGVGSVVRYEAKVDSSVRYQEKVCFFVLLESSSGELYRNDGSNSNLESYYYLLQAGVKKGKCIFAEQKLLAYRVQNSDGSAELYFLDISLAIYQLVKILRSFLLAIPVAFAAILFVSYLMAKKAVRPVEETWDKQRRFISDASHEIKTPLAVISANTDALLTSPEQSGKWVKNIQDEIADMSLLVNNLLELAQADEAQTQAHTDTVVMTQVVQDAITRYEASIYEKGIDLKCAILQNVRILCDEEKLKRIVSILMDNALKYTKPGGKISVSLTQHHRGICFSVENSGDGISPEDIPYIFDRFYRADGARSDSGSFGLGLSIAKSLAEQIGGKLSASSQPGRSTLFCLELNT